MSLIQSWRWYGPGDPVSLNDIKQAGASAIVTALHQLDTGEVWPTASISERQKLIESHGLEWLVVESVNIHDAIKLGLPEKDQYIDNYLETLANLAQCGVNTVCYNFMPVLDWTRTDLSFETKTGARALRYDHHAIAAFDRFVLKREGAINEYTSQTWTDAESFWEGLDNEAKSKLQQTILAGLPGTSKTLSVDYFKTKLTDYKSISINNLKHNYKYFIERVAPEAQALGIKLALHPDDPPFPIFGIPRMVGTPEDLDFVLQCSNLEAHGLTLCTGSLGPSCASKIPEIIEKWGNRLHFLHLRNIRLTSSGFYEAEHLDGEVDMYEVMKSLTLEMERRKTNQSNWRIPMRPDHGHQMVDDLQKEVVHPGYSAIGRLRGLAELRGLELGVRKALNLN